MANETTAVNGTWYLVIQGYDLATRDDAEALRRGLVKIELRARTQAQAIAEAEQRWQAALADGTYHSPDGTLYPRSPRVVFALELGGAPAEVHEPRYRLAPDHSFIYETHRVVVDYGKTLREMLELAHVGLDKKVPQNWLDHYLWPLSGPEPVTLHLAQTKVAMNDEDVLSVLLRTGFRSGTLPEVLAAAIQSPEMMKGKSIALVGRVWGGEVCCLRLHRPTPLIELYKSDRSAWKKMFFSPPFAAKLRTVFLFESGVV